MSNVIFIGDFQTYSKPNAWESGKDILDVSLEALERVFEIADQTDSPKIIHAGDFFEHPNPSQYVLNRTVKFLQGMYERFPDIMLQSITGNHDYPQGVSNDFPPDKTSLQLLQKSVPNFEVIDYTEIPIGDYSLSCIPFIRNEPEWLEFFDRYLAGEPEKRILLMHQDVSQIIKGSLLSATAISKHFEYVLDGHIHGKQGIGNFMLLGSLLQQKAGDIEEGEKGCHIFNSDEGKFSFVPMPHPKFVKYYVDEEVPEKDRGNYILRQERPIVSKKNLKPIDDTTAQGKGDAGIAFLGEKLPDAIGLEDELTALIARVNPDKTTNSKTIEYLRVEVEGFRSWLNGSYQLNSGNLTYIQAAKGSGKSSIFEAIYWCEFGELLREKAVQDDIIPEKWLQQQDLNFRGTRVTLWKIVDGIRYKVTRCLGYKGDVSGIRGNDNFILQTEDGNETTNCTASHFNLTDEEFSNKSKKTKAWIEHCGIDSQTFLNSVIFTPDKCNMVQANDADKRKLLEPLLQVDWVDRVKDLAKVERLAEAEIMATHKTTMQVKGAMAEGIIRDLEQIETNRKNFEGDKKLIIDNLQIDLDENVANEQWFIDDLAEKKTAADEFEANIDETLPQQLAEKTKELSAKHEEVVKAKAIVDNLQIELKGKEKKKTKRHVELEAERADWGIEKQRLTNLVGESKNAIAEVVLEIRGIEADPTLIEKESKLDAELKVARMEAQNQDDAIKLNRRTKQSKQLDFQQAERTISNLEKQVCEDTENCPVCKGKLPEGHDLLAERERVLGELRSAKELKKTIEAEIAELEKEHSKMLLALDKLNVAGKGLHEKAVVVGMEITADKEKKEQALNEKKKQLENEKLALDNKLNAIPAKLVKIDSDIAAEEREAEKVLETETRAIREKIAEAETAKNLKVAGHNKIQLVIDALNMHLHDLPKQRESLKKLRQEQSTAETDLKEMRRAISDLKSELEKARKSEFKDATEKQKKADKKAIIAEMDDINSKMEKVQSRIDSLQKIETTVCGAKGLKAYLIQRKLDRINEFATEYANQLGTSIHFYLDESMNYRCTLMIEGRERDARKASTGQLVIANLILTGAVGKLNDEKVKINFRVLDEPFSNVDADTSYQISQLLSAQATESGISLHVITHSQSLDLTNANIVRIEGGEKMPSRFVA